MSRFYNPDIDISSTHRDYRYSYTYDELNRLTVADYSYGSSGSSSSWFDVNNLSYDANGNIQSLRRRNEAGTLIDRLRFDYNGNNLLEAVDDTSGVHLGWDAFSSSFTYDDNGNMISQSGKFTNIAYDHRNLPIHFYMDSGAELIANYNSEGQRILKESSGGAWSFYVTDGPQTLAVITEQGLSHMNLVGNGTFGRIPVNLSGNITMSNTRYYHITDHLGSTREVVNNSGAWVETFDYYPFGLLMPGRNTASAETREKFTGHERDDEVGLDYMVWRRYDPALGRFLSVDPMASEFPGWSPYVYALNNPLIFIDPDGRFSTHVDSTGNVIAVYDDEDLGVYQHSDLGRGDGSRVAERRTNTSTTHGGGTQVGHTLHERSFSVGNQIDLSGADTGGQLIDYFSSQARQMGLLRYAASAIDGGPLDVKGQTNIGGYVEGGSGLIVSSRDVGNIVAGMVARDYSLLTPNILAAYGEFNVLRGLQGGRKTDAVISIMLGMGTSAVLPPNQATVQGRMFLKEDPETIKGILYGLSRR